MNSRFQELAEQAGMYVDLDGKPWPKWMGAEECEVAYARFAELIVKECIGILEAEIELVNGYKSTACNDFDVCWHQGKIEHFAKLVEKSKKHFGVKE
jgi:hypothetical protein